jgi:hypothetical protein
LDKIAELLLLSRELLEISERLCDRLGQKINIGISLKIAHLFVLKATRTLKAVIILFEGGLCEQAQALVRILFELRLNFDCFLQMASKDYRLACFRIIDAMMLEKIKQQRASNFAGLGMIPDSPTIENFETAEKEIASRYTLEEIKRLKKYGFTGVPIEQRAKMTGHEEAYDIEYRNFSRNIHSTDYMELYMLQGSYNEDKRQD